VNGAIGERGRERVVDEPVLLDEGETLEAPARNGHLEVIAAAGAVLDGELSGVRERVAEKLLEAGRHAGDDTSGGNGHPG
jgi:hypothetical protein